MHKYMTTAPNPPMINGVTAIDSTSVQVDWSIPTNPNGILTVYAITYNIEGGVSMTVNVQYNGQLVMYMCTYIGDIHTYIIRYIST